MTQLQHVYVVNPSAGGGGGGGTVDQGNPNTCPNAWPMKFTDGTNCVTAGDNTNNAVRVNMVASNVSSSGGWSVLKNLDLGTTGEVIKASAGQVGGYFISNLVDSPVYVKFYNKATAPTSSDTPVLTLAIPSSAAANVLGVAGLQFNTGISWRASTGVADNDNTAPAANQVVANVFYN